MKTKAPSTVFFGMLVCIFQASFAGNTQPKINGNHPTNTFELPKGITNADFEANTIIFKLQPQYRSIATNNGIPDARLTSVFSELGMQSMEKLFPHHTAPAFSRNAQGQELADLSLIYQLHFTGSFTIESAINKLIATGMVMYAEPRYIQYEHSIKTSIKDIAGSMAVYNPNDPDITNFAAGMYYIGIIKCPEAWAINMGSARGDSTTVIGIVDSGTDIDHPDLVSKIKYNYNDPINGIDDDKDGFIDNFRGWDISENDNNPNVDNAIHGSHVSGCAAAATDNGVGVASPGFKCTFLPVKCAKASSTSQINNGYEGIIYAADHGCHIINCSWGGPGGGQFGQDAITYATINKNVLVVASAGNSNDEVKNYPGAYNWVFCVASTTSTDESSSFSSYGSFVDVCSPGSAIRSTVFDDQYQNMSGTSMASPICAGAAGIVKTFYPSYTALQIGEQLRVTADDIYGIGSNGSDTYKDKLGRGRINLYRALTESSPSVRMAPISINDNNDEVFIVNDTLFITGTMVNYLAATTHLTATLSTSNTDVTILNPSLNPGALGTLATFPVTKTNAYKVFIKPGTPVNASIPFKITYSDGSYSDFQLFEVTVNVDYLNITVNDVSSTTTSKGRIGWNKEASGGLGFVYKDSAMLYEAGLMIGISSSNVCSNVRGSGTGSDTDFNTVEGVKQVIPSVQSEFDTYGVFNDNGATSNKIGVEVAHKSFAWSTAGNKKYIIFEYTIKNTSGAPLSNLFAGIFADWDITDNTSGNNKANTDSVNKLGYIYSTVGTKLYGGTRLLTGGSFFHYAIDNIPGGDGGVDIQDNTDAFSTSEKYTTLSTNRATAGGTATGNDVLNVVSTGPLSIAADASVKVAFALIAGDDLADLIASANNAQIKYDLTVGIQSPENFGSFSLKQNFPNPVNGSKTTIEFYLPEKVQAELTVYNTMGQKMMTVVNSQLGAGIHQYTMEAAGLKNGIYFYELKAGNYRRVMKMIIQNNSK